VYKHIDDLQGDHRVSVLSCIAVCKSMQDLSSPFTRGDIITCCTIDLIARKPIVPTCLLTGNKYSNSNHLIFTTNREHHRESTGRTRNEFFFQQISPCVRSFALEAIKTTLRTLLKRLISHFTVTMIRRMPTIWSALQQALQYHEIVSKLCYSTYLSLCVAPWDRCQAILDLPG
jgi:hypothetical protein